MSHWDDFLTTDGGNPRDAGRAAASTGQDKATCPHKPGTPEWKAWQHGWLDSRNTIEDLAGSKRARSDAMRATIERPRTPAEQRTWDALLELAPEHHVPLDADLAWRYRWQFGRGPVPGDRVLSGTAAEPVWLIVDPPPPVHDWSLDELPAATRDHLVRAATDAFHTFAVATAGCLTALGKTIGTVTEKLSEFGARLDG